MTKLALILTAIALPTLPAQTRTKANAPTCPGVANAPRIYAELPATIGATKVMVPLCVTLGSGFVLDTTMTPPTLRATAQPAPTPQPWLAIDRVDLGALNIPATQPEVTYTLSKTPIEGSALLAIRRGATVDAVPTAPGRELIITLPAGPRPFVAGEDVVILVYLTTDAK